MARKAVLLVNLGSPDAPTVPAVRRYLRQFLSDPRVIDIPGPLRFLLVNGIIVPFRSPKSAHAYQQVWSAEGSPLVASGKSLARKVQDLWTRFSVL
jgi:ferrochelatase